MDSVRWRERLAYGKKKPDETTGLATWRDAAIVVVACAKAISFRGCSFRPLEAVDQPGVDHPPQRVLQLADYAGEIQ